MKPLNLSGQKFGRLSVLCRRGSSNDGKSLWECKCDCGNVGLYVGKRLKSGNTKSCGCLSSETTAKRNVESATHGMANTITYNTWDSMKQRCLNEDSEGYRHYGGRGISVCDRWMTFQNFIDDMGERPSGKTIDRIDVNGNYEPGNCRWATPVEQGNNRRSNVFIEFNGLKLTATQWAEKIGIGSKTIMYRLKNGWSVFDTLNTPTNHGNAWLRGTR